MTQKRKNLYPKSDEIRNKVILELHLFHNMIKLTAENKNVNAKSKAKINFKLTLFLALPSDKKKYFPLFKGHSHDPK